MEIQPQRPTTKAPAETFTGDAWFDVLAQGQPPSRMRVNVVRFAPGARNAWHGHANGQTLHVTEGIGRVQSRGEKVTELHPGDTVLGTAGGVALAWRQPRAFHDPPGHVGKPGRRPGRPGNQLG